MGCPVCLPGAVRNLGEAAGGQEERPTFLSTDLGDKGVGMGAACPPGTTLQVPQGSGMTQGGEGVPLLGTACMCVRVCVWVGGMGQLGSGGFYSFRPGQAAQGGVLGSGTEAVKLPTGSERKGHTSCYTG